MLEGFKRKKRLAEALVFYILYTVYAFIAAGFFLSVEMIYFQPDDVALKAMLGSVLGATCGTFAAGMACLILAEKHVSVVSRAFTPILVAIIGFTFPILAFAPVAWATMLKPKG